MSAEVKTHEERIEALTFYGTGAEPYELFQATCSLAYQCSGCGLPEAKAMEKQLVAFAEALAANSKLYADDYDEDDTAQGEWGY